MDDCRRYCDSHNHHLGLWQLGLADRTVSNRDSSDPSHVRVDDSIEEYVLDIVHLTRNCDELHVGVSTRGAISLYRAAQASAMLEGRTFVVPDDVKQLAVSVLSHRVQARGHLYDGQRQSVEAIIQRLVDKAPMPE